MALSNRWRIVGLSLLIAVLAMWGALAAAAAPANGPAALAAPLAAVKAAPAAQPAEDEPPLIGYPCGDGAQPLPWAICLYGYFVDGDGRQAPIAAGLNVTVTYHNEATGLTGAKSTVTRVRPGDSVASYALDISPLEPDYMGEVTLAVEGYGAYQVIVNPNMRTQNLQFDVPVGEATARGRAAAVPPGQVWGYVVDFEHNAPIDDVAVTISSGEGDDVVSLITRTVNGPALAEPYYAFSAADLRTAGVIITKTFRVEAQYNGDRVARVVEPPAEGQAAQVNLFTGWMCDTADGRDLLPQVGSDTGAPPLPETTGADGLPDMGCFWGYVGGTNGEAENVTVHLEVAGRAYEDTTFVFDLEKEAERPRYGIIVPEVEQIAGRPLTVTAVLSGSIATHTTTVALDAAHSQRIDLQLDVSVEEGTLEGPGGTNSIVSLGNSVYVGNDNGLTHFGPTGDGQRVTGGPWAAPVSEVTLDKDNCLWLISEGRVYRHCPANEGWWEFDEEETGAAVTAIAVSADDAVWFGNAAGELHVYREGGAPEWATIAVTGLDLIRDLSVSPTGVLWVAAGRILGRYDPAAETGWHSVASATEDAFLDVAADGEGAWVIEGSHGSSGSGLLHAAFTPSAGIVLTDHSSQTEAFCDNRHEYWTIEVDEASNVWVVCSNKVLRRDAAAETWTSVIDELGNNAYYSIAVDSVQQSVWLGSWNAVAQYGLETGDFQRQFTITDIMLPFSEALNAVAADSDSLFVIHHYGDGLVHFDGLTQHDPNTLEFVAAPKGGFIDAGAPLALTQDRTDNSLWIAIAGQGVSHYIPGAAVPWVNYPVSNDSTTGLMSDQVYAIGTYQGEVWFATSAGISVLTLSTSQWRAFTGTNYYLHQETDPSVRENVSEDMVIDDHGNVWLSGDEGLRVYSRQYGWKDCLGIPVSAIDYNPVDESVWLLYKYVEPGPFSDWASPTAVDAPYGEYWLRSIGVDAATGQCMSRADYVRLHVGGETALTTDLNGDIWVSVNCTNSPCTDDNSETTDLTPGYYTYDPVAKEWQFQGVLYASERKWLDSNLQRDKIILRRGTNSRLTILDVAPKQPDLSLSLSAPTEWITGTLAYTLVVANTGVRPATATALTLDLPAGVTFAKATCVGGPVNCVPTGGDPLIWALGDLAPEQVVTITVNTTVNIPAPIGATLEATATVTTTAAETYTLNNTAGPAATLVGDSRPDARVTIIGPQQFAPGEEAVLTVRADNVGGSTLTDAAVELQLGPHLSSDDDLTWTIDSLPASDPETGQTQVDEHSITVRVAANAPSGVWLEAGATINNPDDPNPLDNTARLTLPTTLQNVTTLVIVADARMEQEYGAGGVMEAVYRLAAHPKVNGLVVDVTDHPTVQAAYADWDTARGTAGATTAANDVAAAISAVISNTRATHPTIAYVVIIGGDHVIPFYRIQDQSATGWRESDYAAGSLPPDTTVYEALSADHFLTDDCYTDRQPTPVTAPGWTSDRGLCQPELPTGRLVETPAEIAAAIDAFIEIDGEVRLASAIIGSTTGNNDAESGSDDARLTLDLDDDQCRILRKAGLNPRCRQSNRQFRESVLATPFDSLWGAQHSSHYSTGALRSNDVTAATADFLGRLLATIGCHAGLSVPPRSDDGSIDYDMAQAWLGHGGFMIGGTAYGYGSKAGIGYSESYLQALTRELARGGSVEVGAAIVRAKQIYVTRHLKTFTHLDEKVVLPMTLYGLPMLRVRTPAPAAPSAPPATGVRLAASTIISPLTPVDVTLFTPHSTMFGAYHDYDGEVFEQLDRPVQPAHDVEVPVVRQDHVVRGALLRSATFTTTAPFVPYRGQPWALSAAGQPPPPHQSFLPLAAGLSVAPTWDHSLPFTFGYFDSGDAATAYVFTILGAYNQATGEERRYNHLALDVVYGLGDDAQPPVIVQSDSYNAYGHTSLVVRAGDAGIAQVVGLCEYAAAGRLESVDLRWNGARWVGRCPALGDVTRTLVQVVDDAGNVTIGDWQTPPTATLSGPDMIIESVVATRDGIEIVIRNVGTTTVTPAQSFWVDAYLEPSRPPSAVNERWDELGDYGAAWEVYLTIAPGAAVTLRTGDSQMHPGYSRLPERLPTGAMVYAHVDVWNGETAYGAVEETHEMADGPYNNIFGPVEVGGTSHATAAAPPVAPAHGTAPARPEVER